MKEEKQLREINEDSFVHQYRGLGILFLCAILVFGGIYSFGGITLETTGNSMADRYEIPISCVETEKKQVALSFDSAGGKESTQEILDILEKYHLKATFFLTGRWIDSYPEEVKKIAAAGHDLGNYGEDARDMSRMNREEMRKEVTSVHEQVKKLTGADMDLFRPPYGAYNQDVITTVYTCGYYPIKWSVDSLDWKDYGKNSIVKTVIQNKELENGAIILMNNGAKYTASALEEVILGLQAKGYEIVPVSKLIYRENYYMNESGKQILDEK